MEVLVTNGGSMEEIKYFVEIDGNRVAENMSIQTALILIEALFAEYYNDKKMLVSICRMDLDEPECGEI